MSDGFQLNWSLMRGGAAAVDAKAAEPPVYIHGACRMSVRIGTRHDPRSEYDIDVPIASDPPDGRSEEEIRANITRILSDTEGWERSRGAARRAREALRRFYRE